MHIPNLQSMNIHSTHNRGSFPSHKQWENESQKVITPVTALLGSPETPKPKVNTARKGSIAVFSAV